ncbi:MAG: ATP-grasp domain-containing protein [Pirellulales bacterium]|nr:ATP-grasp domain-containing protein [Pirellulales bacterium]
MKTLALVGASVRAAAMSARRAGWMPVAADLFGDADLCALCCAEQVKAYPRDLAIWLAKVHADAWLYTGGLENHPELIDRMAHDLPLLGNPGMVLRPVRSVALLARVLREHGFFFPEIRQTSHGLPQDGTWLVKTHRGSSGLGVYPFEGGIYERRWSNQPLQAGQVFYQKRIEGTPGSAVFVAAMGRSQLLGVTRQLVGTSWTAARPFQYAGSIGPWPIGKPAMDTLRALGDVLSHEFNLVGLFGVDFVLAGNRIDSGHRRFVSQHSLQESGANEDVNTMHLSDIENRDTADGKVWIIEVNPRYTASVEIVERLIDCKKLALESQTARDIQPVSDRRMRLLAMHVAACQGHTLWTAAPPESQPASPCHGKAILFARQDIRVPRSFTSWALGSNNDPLDPKVADIPHPNTEITRGYPIATCFATGPTPQDVACQLHRQIANMEEKLVLNEP